MTWGRLLTLHSVCAPQWREEEKGKVRRGEVRRWGGGPERLVSSSLSARSLSLSDVVGHLFEAGWRGQESCSR